MGSAVLKWHPIDLPTGAVRNPLSVTRQTGPLSQPSWGTAYPHGLTLVETPEVVQLPTRVNES